jgi:hypothetical protein
MSAIDARRLRVRAIDAARVVLDPVARCEGCAACPRRCTGILSGFAADDGLALPRAALPGVPAIGDEFLLRADIGALGRSAAVLRGLPLAGLLAGAAAGALGAVMQPAWREALVAIGAVAGIAIGLHAATLRMRRQSPAFTLVPWSNPETVPTPCATRPVS